jgi:ribosomal protein L24E
MGLFKKKCALCGRKIEKGKELIRAVKVPEFADFKDMPFCSKKHAQQYDQHIKGTPRRNFCPSCGV